MSLSFVLSQMLPWRFVIAQKAFLSLYPTWGQDPKWASLIIKRGLKDIVGNKNRFLIHNYSLKKSKQTKKSSPSSRYIGNNMHAYRYTLMPGLRG